MEDSPFCDPAVGLVQEFEREMEVAENGGKVEGGERENGEKGGEEEEEVHEGEEDMAKDGKPPMGPRAKASNPT